MKTSQKFILILAGNLLFSLHPTRAYFELCWPGARRAKDVSDMTGSLRKILVGMGYNAKMCCEIIIELEGR